MVPNTSDDLPEPDTPVNTVSRRPAAPRLPSFRLGKSPRAPRTRITNGRRRRAALTEEVDLVMGYGEQVSSGRMRIMLLAARTACRASPHGWSRWAMHHVHLGGGQLGERLLEVVAGEDGSAQRALHNR